MNKEELKKIIVEELGKCDSEVNIGYKELADNILAKVPDEVVIAAMPGSWGLQKIVIDIEQFDVYEFWIDKERFIFGKTDLENLIQKDKGNQSV